MAQVSEDNILNLRLPYSPEAEKSVIAVMLMDMEAVETVLGILNEEDFYSRRYAVMFRAVRELYEDGSAVDLVTVRDRLMKDGAPEELQSLEFLVDLFEFNAVSVYARSYASIVRDKAVERSLIRECAEISRLCYEDSESTEDILAEAEKRIFDVLKLGVRSDQKSIEDISLDVMKKIQQASLSKDHITGIPTGFLDLDNMTTGFQPSDLILIAARPSMGKTAFVLNIMEYVAIRKNRPCMIFSLEMSREQLVQRLFAMDSGIDTQRLRTGRIEGDDWDRLVETAERVGSSNIIIDDTPGIGVAELRSKARKVKLEHGLDMVIIDYLQLMSGSGIRRNDNRQTEVSEISRALKALARDLECPVVAISQLSRAPEARSDKHPMLSDLRESGAIEQDADVVMFLYREEYYEPETPKKGEAEVIIAKQRNGPTGLVRLYWQADTTRFLNRERNS